MGLFDQFPYTNFHELNLDWILKALKELEHTIEQFVAINALKYADPIQWNITSQYEKNTIVIDPLTGTAYISVQPVPSGVALTNEDYWTVVFDLGSFVTRAAKNFTIRYEDATTLTATFSSAAGEWLVWGDTLYVANVNITAGDSYVEGGNITHITMEDIIGHLADLDTTNKNNLISAINELVTSIGDLSTLTTTDTTSIVNAINELVSSIVNINSNIGDLSTLGTTDKSSVVNAINEVNTNTNNLKNDVGNLSDLNTTDKSSIINAINEVLDDVLNVKALDWFNVKDYGAVGDNVTNDTAAINAAIDALNARGYGVLYFPAGHYYIDGALNRITARVSIFGDGQGSTIIENHNTTDSFDVFTIGTTNGLDAWDMHDLHFIGAPGTQETWIHHVAGNYVSVHDIKISSANQFIYVGSLSISSILINIYNIRGWTRGYFCFNSGMIAGCLIHDCNLDNSPQNVASAIIADTNALEFDTFAIYDSSFVGYKNAIVIANNSTNIKSNLFIQNNIFDVIYERSIMIVATTAGNYTRAYIRNNWLTSKTSNTIDIIGTASTPIYQIDICDNEFLEANWSNINMSYVIGATVNDNQMVTHNMAAATSGVACMNATHCDHMVITGNLMTNQVPTVATSLNAYAFILDSCTKFVIVGNDCMTYTNAPVFAGCTDYKIYANLGITDQAT